MTPGSLRYPRSLGFVGGGKDEPPTTGRRETPAMAVASNPNSLERILGWDLQTAQGKGLLIGTTPTNLASMIVGAGLGAIIAKNKVMGVVLGGLLGGGIAVGLKAAGVANI